MLKLRSKIIESNEIQLYKDSAYIMEIFPIVLGISAGICIATGIIYLFIGLRRRDEKQLNLTSSLPILLNLELEQNALLLYSR